MDLGQRIVLFRAKNRISQIELAKELGIGIATMRRAEKNEIGKVTRALIENYLKEKGEV